MSNEIINFPRRTLSTLGTHKTIAVEPHMTMIPAYAEAQSMNLGQMKEWAKKNDGVIMQQDDGWFPPFVLYKYLNGDLSSVS